MKQDFLRIRHPSLRPLWLRAAIVIGTGLWTLLELSWGNKGWAALIGAIAAYSFFEFFVIFDPKNYEDENG